MYVAELSSSWPLPFLPLEINQSVVCYGKMQNIQITHESHKTTTQTLTLNFPSKKTFNLTFSSCDRLRYRLYTTFLSGRLTLFGLSLSLILCIVESLFLSFQLVTIAVFCARLLHRAIQLPLSLSLIGGGCCGAGQASVEATREHPFYVSSKGWSSCDPERTLERYGLPCKQLVVGDCCLALSRVSPSTLSRAPSPAAGAGSLTQGGARSSTDDQVDAPLDYSTAGTANT